MDLADYRLITNIILAGIAVVPAFLVLKNLRYEYKDITQEQKPIYILLVVMTSTFMLVSVINLLAQLFLIIRWAELIGYETFMGIVRIRTLIVNLGIACAGWTLYLTQQKTR